jgi:hypothetical protein
MFKRIFPWPKRQLPWPEERPALLGVVTDDQIAAASLPDDSTVNGLVENEEIRGIHDRPQATDAHGIGLALLFDIDEDPFLPERKGEVQKIEGIGVICKRMDTRVVGECFAQGTL